MPVGCFHISALCMGRGFSFEKRTLPPAELSKFVQRDRRRVHSNYGSADLILARWIMASGSRYSSSAVKNRPPSARLHAPVTWFCLQSRVKAAANVY